MSFFCFISQYSGACIVSIKAKIGAQIFKQSLLKVLTNACGKTFGRKQEHEILHNENRLRRVTLFYYCDYC